MANLRTKFGSPRTHVNAGGHGGPPVILALADRDRISQDLYHSVYKVKESWRIIMDINVKPPHICAYKYARACMFTHVSICIHTHKKMEKEKLS